MQLAIIVLNKTECLEKLLAELWEAGITGATILDSAGMAHSLYDHEDLRIVASLRRMLDPQRKESKTLFMVAEDDQIAVISKVANRVTGGLEKPDTGILFSLPVNYVEGL